MKKLILMTGIIIAGVQAHAGMWDGLYLLTCDLIGLAGDDICNSFAHDEVDERINAAYVSARQCSPMERDPVTGRSVDAFMSQKPSYPSWRVLSTIESEAYLARIYAESEAARLGLGGYDKVEHCLAGCFISQRDGFSAAALVGFAKEVSDASDCSPSTHFEEADYYATLAGAYVAQRPYVFHGCGFCTSTAVDMTGAQMLERARPAPSQGKINNYAK